MFYQMKIKRPRCVVNSVQYKMMDDTDGVDTAVCTCSNCPLSIITIFFDLISAALHCLCFFGYVEVCVL